MTRKELGISDKWTDVCELLNSRDAVYLVIGGVAVALHGYVRATKDIDILVPRDIANTKRILDALSDLPWGIAKELSAEDVHKKPITIIGDDPRVDILKGAQGITYDAARKRQLTTTIAGTTVPYINLDDLIRSKTGTNRPKDQQDIIELKRALRRAKRHTANNLEQKTSTADNPAGKKKKDTIETVVRGKDRPVGGQQPGKTRKKQAKRHQR